MSMRVTQQMITARSLTDISFQTRKLFQIQEQLGSGLKVNSPDDDPLAARRAINIRASITKNDQYVANISAVGPQLLETTTALQTVQTTLQRAQELALQGANGTVTQTQRNQVAIEVNQLIETVMEQANHQTNGKYIFGGTRTTNLPFVATRNAQNEITAVTYEGNTETVNIAVGDGATVTVNENGNDAFLSTQDVFQTLIDIRDNLRAGNTSELQNQRLDELAAGRNQLLISMARIGSIENRVETVTDNTEDYTVKLKQDLSDNIDADYAETIINLNTQSNAFQAALSAAARVVQPSLLDYIR